DSTQLRGARRGAGRPRRAQGNPRALRCRSHGSPGDVERAGTLIGRSTMEPTLTLRHRSIRRAFRGRRGPARGRWCSREADREAARFKTETRPVDLSRRAFVRGGRIMPATIDDWRLHGQERYLEGAVLHRARYHKPDGEWDHDHCEFCWEPFVEDGCPDE